MEDGDLDAMLSESQLADIGEKFYARYHLQYDAKIAPSDQLVSAMAKQLGKRLLQAKL